MYWDTLTLDDDWPLQHAHIDNTKTVANVLNNEDVYMCILCFHAQAGYLQHYEALLKELNAQVPEDDAGPQAEPEPQDQYTVESFAPADRNHNLPSESPL
jgi:hypothetical protein